MKTLLCFFFSFVSLFSSINSNDISEKSIVINGETRTYLSKAPIGHPPAGGWPVIFMFHGAMQQGGIWFKYDGFKTFTAKALAKGYYVIAPNARYRAKGTVENVFAEIGAPRWNTQVIPHGPPPLSADFGNDDINFIHALLEKIERRPSLNAGRVYFTGFSSGAAFTILASLVFTSRIKSASINSGGYIGKIDFQPPPPGHPPMLINHGVCDYVVRYEKSLEYFEDLHQARIHAKLNLAEGEGHHWLSDYDEDVFDWFEMH